MTLNPLFKWAGGKRKMLPLISQHIKKLDVKELNYIEPFVGGGSVFLNQLTKGFKTYAISDINLQLINVYWEVFSDYYTLSRSLDCTEEEYNALKSIEEREQYFSDIRATYNTLVQNDVLTTESAVLFLTLNKLCFNGLYRVNNKGDFNTSFGKKEKVTFNQSDNLFRVHKEMRNNRVKIRCNCYRVCNYPSDSFVYLDPPYASVDNSFDSYDSNGVKLDELHYLCETLNKRGSKFLLHNFETPEVLQLFRSFNIDKVETKSNLSGKGDKSLKEVIITNF